MTQTLKTIPVFGEYRKDHSYMDGLPETTQETIVFFGSGPVAAQSLELLRQHTAIEAVITKSSTLTDMTKAAHGAPVFVANNKTELDKLSMSQPFQSTLGVVIDFGVIISRATIDTFPLGIINSHFSLLPQWRGADPITFSILSGQQTTGVSLMLINEALDEGDILAQGTYTLPSHITTPELTNALVLLSNELLKKTVPAYMQGHVSAISQEAAAAAAGVDHTPSYSRKLTKQDGTINWHKPAIQIEREIRAFAGWPRSTCKLGNVEIVITKATVTQDTLRAGEIRIAKNYLGIGCGESSLQILSVIPIGKKEMDTASFLNGYGSRLPAHV